MEADSSLSPGSTRTLDGEQTDWDLWHLKLVGCPPQRTLRSWPLMGWRVGAPGRMTLSLLFSTAATTGRLSSQQKTNHNYFDNQLTTLLIFQANVQPASDFSFSAVMICWFSFLFISARRRSWCLFSCSLDETRHLETSPPRETFYHCVFTFHWLNDQSRK